MQIKSFFLNANTQPISTNHEVDQRSIYQRITNTMKSSISSFGKNLGWGARYGLIMSIPEFISVLRSERYGETLGRLDVLYKAIKFDDFIIDPDYEFKLAESAWIVGVLAPIFEEVVFRGILQNGTKRISKYAFSKVSDWNKNGLDEKYSSKVSRVTSSVIFGAHHMTNVYEFGKISSILQSIFSGIFGYFMISKTYEENGLLGACGMHIGNNIAVFAPTALDLFLKRRYQYWDFYFSEWYCKKNIFLNYKIT